MRLVVPILINCALVLAVYLADKHTSAKKLPYIAKQIIKKNSEKRQRSVPSTAALGSGLAEGEMGVEVTIGGAIVFTVDVESVDKY